MPYHIYTRSGVGAVGIIVETARDALAKAAEFVEDGHPDVLIKNLLGNAMGPRGGNRLGRRRE